MEKTGTLSRILIILLGVICVVAGFYAIFNPIATDLMIPIFLGSILLVYGIVMAISYFMNSKNRSIWSLVLAVVVILLGLVILGGDLLRLITTTYLIGYITAGALIAIGAIKAVNSFTLKKFGMSTWWTVLVLGILDVIIGIILFMNPLTIAIYLGAGLIADGISDLMIGIMAM